MIYLLHESYVVFWDVQQSMDAPRVGNAFHVPISGRKLIIQALTGTNAWIPREHAIHLQHAMEVKSAKTSSRQHELQKQYGVRYSELLRLPYVDIIQFHVVDPKHNMLLGTSKHMMKVWKEQGILNDPEFQRLQHTVNEIKVPAGIGRIPFRIDSGFTSFTADQWKNWTCIYSLYCLHGVIPQQHYACWSLFVEACCFLLQPSISLQELEEADEKLQKFCRTFQDLYGREHCTPNMHMHLHLKIQF